MQVYNVSNAEDAISFRAFLMRWYAANGRHKLPWRLPEPDGTFDPYKIMVSELMLQQTQVKRVMPKYHEFLTKFPTASSLARADLADVLRSWQGLGYNRRAKYLWQAAKIIHRNSEFPATEAALIALPGIGKNTAGAILAYAFNRPAVFVETNIRTVFLHHVFRDKQNVSDVAILDAAASTIDAGNPREFYWALMDYGKHLKTVAGNVNMRSRHYVKQSVFQGSQRQIRGRVLRELGARTLSRHELTDLIADERLPTVLIQLQQEGLVRLEKDVYALGS